MIRKPNACLAGVSILAAFAMAAACGGAPETEAPEAAAPETSAPPTEPAGSSTIAGTITYNGEVRKLRPLSMSADPACAAKHPEPVKSEMLVLGEGNTMANVLVRVKGGLPDRKWPTPSEPVVMDQRGCRYSPHVMGIMVNQPFRILNSDGLLHNVHALPEVNREFNMAMPASRTEAMETFNKEEDIFKIKCDVHPWMNAFVGVMGHPYFSVTRADGEFALSGLPAGTYEVEAWHERLGVKTESVTVADGETATVSFAFTM